jgi:CDP-glucose 4,6-dehydratase
MRQPVRVRNPQATRPWQHVLDCLSGYLCLGAVMARSPHWNEWAFNFGPSSASNQPVRSLVVEILKHWPGSWQDDSDPGAVHEASRLHLSTDKAAAVLGWQPTWQFADAVRQTILWYKARHEGADMKAFTLGQIETFCSDAAARNLPWTATT